MKKQKRLIDANALKEKAIWITEIDKHGRKWDIKVVTIFDINNAPTVKPWWKRIKRQQKATKSKSVLKNK